jgi:hypothetical protein
MGTIPVGMLLLAKPGSFTCSIVNQPLFKSDAKPKMQNASPSIYSAVGEFPHLARGAFITTRELRPHLVLSKTGR